MGEAWKPEGRSEFTAVILVRNNGSLDYLLTQKQATSKDRYVSGRIGSCVKIIFITRKRNSSCFYIKKYPAGDSQLDGLQS